MAAVTLKLICLLLVLLLSSTSAWLSTAHEAAEADAATSTEKEGVGDDVLDGTRNEIGERKMVARKVTVKRVDMKSNGAVAETSWISSANHEIAGGKSWNKEKMKKKNKGGENGASKPRVSNINGQLNNESGFVAFSSDYHAPRHHPPKNN